MNQWSLPKSAQIASAEYRINADYRDVLDIIARLDNQEQDEQTRLYVALALFYDTFSDMPESDYREAAEWMFRFISCGDEADGKKRPKTIDWEQDQSIIISDINKVAGCEVRALPFCHWWTFVSWFNAIGDGQLSTVVSIREKRRKGKRLTDWEQEFYRNNREKVDFKSKYIEQDDDVLAMWMGKKKAAPG